MALRPPYSSSKLTYNHNVMLSTASAHRACFQHRVGLLALLQVPAVSAIWASSTPTTLEGLGCLAFPGSRERPVAHGHVLSCRQVVRPWRSFRSHPETAARSLRTSTRAPNGSINKRRGAQITPGSVGKLAWITPAGTNAPETNAFQIPYASIRQRISALPA